MQVPITEAVQLTGKSDKTLYRHISQGKLSATRNAQGQKVVDVAELQRVYGDLRTENRSENTVENADEKTQEIVRLPENAQPAPSEALLTAQQSEIEFLRGQLKVANEQTARLLSAQETLTLALPKPEPDPEPKGEKAWWRLWGFLRNPLTML